MIALVVVSAAAHVGISVNDIPVIEDLILRRLLIWYLKAPA